MKVLVMSDVHGNREAFKAVLNRAAEYADIKACILLGDLIDYGMHSNEIIQMVRAMPYPIICNIRGNHEDAVIRSDFSRFSSERGQNSARYTQSILNQDSWNYINNDMVQHGRMEFVCAGKQCLAVHGGLEDEYWKSLDTEGDLSAYSGYDYVFTGHSHLPHFVEKYFRWDDAAHRNKKKVIFINPGSVGQPRNHNNQAQFVILDMELETISFEKVNYDIESEQASYHGQVDSFYRDRLKLGV